MAGDSEKEPLSFADFLEKMKDPAAADLVRSIKSFIKHFDERNNQGHPEDLETDSAIVQSFYEKMEPIYRSHVIWRSAPQTLPSAMEGLEKYVMSKLWQRTFGCTREERDRDERYLRLTDALNFVDLGTLMGTEVKADELLLHSAIEELVRMDRYKAPRDKLVCLVNVKTFVENIVSSAARSGASIGGADAFFPVFLLVVIRARMPHLASNIEYIKRFRGKPRLYGQFDYMLCNLESAAMYLDTVDWRHLHLSKDEFLARLSAAGIPEAEMELRSLQQLGTNEPAVLKLTETTIADPDTKAGAGIEVERSDGRSNAERNRAHEGGDDTLGHSGHLSPLDNAIAVQLLVHDTEKEFSQLSHRVEVQLRVVDGRMMGHDGEIMEPGPPGKTQPEGESNQKYLQLLDDTAIVPQHLTGHDLQDQNHSPNARQNCSNVIMALIAEGTGLVLDAEANGALQNDYPFMYASAEDLTLVSCYSVLVVIRT